MKFKFLNFILIFSLLAIGTYLGPNVALAACNVSVSVPADFTVQPGVTFGLAYSMSFEASDGDGQYGTSYSLVLDSAGQTVKRKDGLNYNLVDSQSDNATIAGGITQTTSYIISGTASSQANSSGLPGCFANNNDTVTVSVQGGENPVCEINSFYPENSNPAYNTGTTLHFSLNDSFPWNISLLQGSVPPSPNSGTSDSGTSSTGNLTGAQVYRLTCGDATRDLTVIPQGQSGPGAPTVTLSASSNAMTLPTNSTTLTWTATNDPTSCTASNAWSGSKSTSGGSENRTGLAAGTYVYTLTCSNSAGSGSDSTSVVVNPAGTSSCTENASVAITGPSTIVAGQTGVFHAHVVNTGDTWWYHGGYFQLVQKSSLNISPTYGHYSPSMPTGATRDFDFTLTAPNTPGTYTLDMQNVRHPGAGSQLDNGTDCAPSVGYDVYFGSHGLANFTVTSVSLPDLTAGSVTPTTAVVNTPVNLSATISNIGDALASGTITHLFQYDDDADHNSGVTTDTTTSNGIAAGGNTPVSDSNIFTTTGTKYVRVCADNNASFVGTITESNEGNNCGGWVNVVVSAAGGPSGGLTAPPYCTIQEGQSTCNASISWTTANIPPGQTPAVTKSPDTTVATGASGSSVSMVVKYDSEIFTLWSSLVSAERVLLSQRIVYANCAINTVWDVGEGECVAGGGGSTCQNPAAYNYGGPLPCLFPPGGGGCPTGNVGLSRTSVNIGQTVTAFAPSEFSGGTFVSNNPAVASVSGSTVTAHSYGISIISGSNWTHTGGATGCSLGGAGTIASSCPAGETGTPPTCSGTTTCSPGYTGNPPTCQSKPGTGLNVRRIPIVIEN